jgi:hypothetical protein
MINGNDPLDFSGIEAELAQRQHRENLILRFFKEAVPNGAKSREAGREICDQVDFVSIIVPGSRDERIRKVDAEIKQRFGPQYEHWLKTQEQPPEGQPLDRVPWLNVAQVRELQYLNIKTLEQLAGLSDTAIQHIGMGGMEMRKKAIAYIEAGKSSAELTRSVARISELERECARLQDTVTAVNARYEALLKERETYMAPTMAPPAPQPPPAPAVDIAALIRAEVAKALNKGE